MPQIQTDLPRLRAGRVGVQFWSVYVPCSAPEPVTAVLEQVELVHRLTERHPDLALCTTADEAEAAFAGGHIASLLGAEGGTPSADRWARWPPCVDSACAT